MSWIAYLSMSHKYVLFYHGEIYTGLGRETKRFTRTYLRKKPVIEKSSQIIMKFGYFVKVKFGGLTP